LFSFTRFEVPSVVKMLIALSWTVTSFGRVCGYRHFGAIYRLHLQGDRGQTFLRNVGNHLKVHTVSQLRRPQSTLLCCRFSCVQQPIYLPAPSVFKYCTRRIMFL
jgi:hypothetical protein